MKKIIPLVFLTTPLLFAAGYQIPNHSLNSIALSTANVAYAHGADSAYFNPANMVYNNSQHHVEISVDFLQLNSIDYDSNDNLFHIKSKQERSIIPSFHYVSKKLLDTGVRVGFSIVSPAGLSRKWEDMPAQATAKQYTLNTIEFNPSIALPINDKFSLAVGFRYIRASGKIELDATPLLLNPPSSVPYSLNISGDATAAGYNVALTYKVTSNINISTTYRSKIVLDLHGNANATFALTPINSKVSILAPIPANFIIASSYTFRKKSTLEFTYDKTMWRAVTETNFNFEDPTLEATLGKPVPKKWHDTTAYRIGLTQKFSTLTAMLGFSYINNASNNEYVSFSSPESDTYTYSFGLRYLLKKNLDIGIAGLIAHNVERSIAQPTDLLGVNGTLGSRNIAVLTLGIGYRF